MAETRRGFLLGLAAYSLWGLFPLYWPLLEPAGAVEILAHRIFWSLVVMLALVVGVRRTRALRANVADRRTRRILVVAAVMITCNWGIFIWAVNHEHVVETSLGYFINPLVTVLMGVVILGERLRRLQWLALTVAGVGVLSLTVEYGHPPWISLALAFSFGSYGLAKKKAHTGAVESLTFETMVIAPFALAYILWLGATGAATFAQEGPGHAVLLAATGLLTAVPLLCFGGAATRVSMTAIGLMQYVTPTMQFLIGVLVYQEPMPALRWVGFVLIWVALTVFTFEAVTHHRRRQLRDAVEASAL